MSDTFQNAIAFHLPWAVSVFLVWRLAAMHVSRNYWRDRAEEAEAAEQRLLEQTAEPNKIEWGESGFKSRSGYRVFNGDGG